MLLASAVLLGAAGSAVTGPYYFPRIIGLKIIMIKLSNFQNCWAAFIVFITGMIILQNTVSGSFRFVFLFMESVLA